MEAAEGPLEVGDAPRERSDLVRKGLDVGANGEEESGEAHPDGEDGDDFGVHVWRVARRRHGAPISRPAPMGKAALSRENCRTGVRRQFSRWGPGMRLESGASSPGGGPACG